MRRQDLIAAADPAVFADRVKANRPESAPGGHSHGPLTSVRTDKYAGHQIVIRTAYEIEIDGQPLGGHVDVTNAGQVHYHPLPNYTFTSAVDMARQVIDTFPDDFPKATKRKRAARKHPGHGG
jgi:hypothetical protein